MKKLVAIITIFLAIKTNPTSAQFPSDSANQTESKVIPYTLPDPLMMQNGKRVKDSIEWMKRQRPYLYQLFEKNVYGHFPQQKINVRYKIREESKQALNGTALRRQVRIYLKQSDTSVYIDVLMYLPVEAKGKVPVFLGLNFNGNAEIQNDPEILTNSNNKVSRGASSSRWPVKTIIENGFGLVTACYNDIEIDNKDGWKTGVRTKLQDDLKIKPEEWGAIGAWAWGLSRIMDYLETDKNVDEKKVAVMGHSRLGKTALWAGASDPRFSLVISNESGEGGAALARRWFGETVYLINKNFPHWFVNAYKSYNHHVFDLPVDQHELLALIAPRPLYVASAAGDLWSDPKGEFLSAWHASEVYSLFGQEGVGTEEMPALDRPIGHRINYHVRTGKHDVTLFDWQQYIRFAKEQWGL
ncbi:MAG: glucuronyl esterase domain-containing protein [Ginsengibacter sp.]